LDGCRKCYCGAVSLFFLFDWWFQLIFIVRCLQEEPDEYGQGKWEGKQEGKSDKRITESKAQLIFIPAKKSH
jgi:hypothetical protein